jgi:hypothetical protein
MVWGRIVFPTSIPPSPIITPEHIITPEIRPLCQPVCSGGVVWRGKKKESTFSKVQIFGIHLQCEECRSDPFRTGKNLGDARGVLGRGWEGSDQSLLLLHLQRAHTHMLA